MSIALGLCLAESHRRVLLCQRDLSFIFLRSFLALSSVRRLFVGDRLLMLSECFLYSDALKLCFTLGFFAFDGFMVCEMFDVLRVVVRLIGLRFGGVVELLLSKGQERCVKLASVRDDTHLRGGGRTLSTERIRYANRRWYLTRTALHIVMVPLCTKVLKARQGSKPCGFKLGQGYFTILVRVNCFENGLNDEGGFLLMLLIVL